MYIYGRSFTIESDHKPLESISQKNLAYMPACVQHMLLHLQGYNYTICYHPSKEMALPNTLSWFSPHPGPDIPVDIAIHHAHLSLERKEAFQQGFVSNPKYHMYHAKMAAINFCLLNFEGFHCIYAYFTHLYTVIIWSTCTGFQGVLNFCHLWCLRFGFKLVLRGAVSDNKAAEFDS